MVIVGSQLRQNGDNQMKALLLGMTTILTQTAMSKTHVCTGQRHDPAGFYEIYKIPKLKVKHEYQHLEVYRQYFPGHRLVFQNSLLLAKNSVIGHWLSTNFKKQIDFEIPMPRIPNKIMMSLPLMVKGKRVDLTCAREKTWPEIAKTGFEDMRDLVNDIASEAGVTSEPLKHGFFECKGTGTLKNGWKASYLIEHFNSELNIFQVWTRGHKDGVTESWGTNHFVSVPKNTAWKTDTLRIEEPRKDAKLTVRHFFNGDYFYTDLQCNPTL